MTTVKHILDRKGIEVCSIERAASALEAAHRMNDRRIGSLVVIEGERVIGIVTERDILRRVVAEELDPARTRIEQIMTSPVACCRLATSLDECRAVMTERRIRHLPVVEDGMLLGIITIGDLMAAQLSDHANTITFMYEYLYQTAAPSGA